MSTYLQSQFQSLGHLFVSDLCEQIDRYEANDKARNALFSCLLIPEFKQVLNLDTAHEIWFTSRDIMRALLMSKLDCLRHIIKSTRTSCSCVESLLIQCSAGLSIVNKMGTNKPWLPYALDRKVWEVKDAAITESPSYDSQLMSFDSKNVTILHTQNAINSLGIK